MKKLEFLVDGWYVTAYISIDTVWIDEIADELACIGYEKIDVDVLYDRYNQFVNQELKVIVIVLGPEW